jgi:hypothetical protein
MIIISRTNVRHQLVIFKIFFLLYISKEIEKGHEVKRELHFSLVEQGKTGKIADLRFAELFADRPPLISSILSFK